MNRPGSCLTGKSHPFYGETDRFKPSRKTNEFGGVSIVRNLTTNQSIAKQSHRSMSASECSATNTFASIARVPDIRLQIAHVVYYVKFVKRGITPPSVIALVSN